MLALGHCAVISILDAWLRLYLKAISNSKLDPFWLPTTLIIELTSLWTLPLPTVSRSLMVPYSAHEMYVLANDVACYHEFLPWCNSSMALQSEGEETLASIGIAFKGWETTFTTRNELSPDRSIHMRLAEGPAFESLTGDWRFERLDELACRIELTVSFSMTGGVTAKMLSPVFSRICAQLIDAFAKRAKQIYGDRAFV